MRYISERIPTDDPALLTLCLTLAVAVGFELLALGSTQVRSIRPASPWREDPFNTAVCAALFTVPPLTLVTGARLLAWDAPGTQDRVQQTLRAAAAIIGAIGVAASFQWASVPIDAGGGTWTIETAALIAALLFISLATAAVALRLVGECRRRPKGRAWRDDWLGDAALLASRVPVMRSLVGPASVAGLRRHATGLFIALSLLAALLIAGAQVIGEGWSDPILIAWAMGVEASLMFAFCIVTNEVAGFIARPPRSDRRRAVDAAVVAGCFAIQVAVAFHEQIWGALGGSSSASATGLVALTIGAALPAAASAAVATMRRGSDIAKDHL